MQKSILDTNVSCFANYDTPDNPRTVKLLQWLKSDKYKNKVEEIRKLTDKVARDEVKATLPAITPSGLFTYRNAKNLLKLSGFIQFDIDLKGNESISNYAELMNQLPNIKNVAYCGLSVSGQGYWGLVPIAYPERHKEHFRAMEIAFLGYGINIDPAPKSIVSLRGYSYDPDGYFNHNAEILSRVCTDVQPERPEFKSNIQYNTPGNDTRAWVERYVNIILNRGIDIAPDYEVYRNIGFAFAEEFGEVGRELFHVICRLSNKYNFDDTEKHYSNFLKSKRQGRIIKIGTFFHYCKQAGIVIENQEGNLSQNKPGAVEAIQV